MENHKRLTDIMQYLLFRKKVVNNHIVNEANYFYDKFECLETSHKKTIFALLICSVMTETSEQIMYGSDFKTFKNISASNKNTSRHIYKLCIIFILQKCRLTGNYSHITNGFDSNCLKQFFGFTPREIKKYKYFTEITRKTPDTFELSFYKYFKKSIYSQDDWSPYTLALTANILYNSYQRFIEAYEMYAKRQHVA